MPNADDEIEFMSFIRHLRELLVSHEIYEYQKMRDLRLNRLTTFWQNIFDFREYAAGVCVLRIFFFSFFLFFFPFSLSVKTAREKVFRGSVLFYERVKKDVDRPRYSAVFRLYL